MGWRLLHVLTAAMNVAVIVCISGFALAHEMLDATPAKELGADTVVFTFVIFGLNAASALRGAFVDRGAQAA